VFIPYNSEGMGLEVKISIHECIHEKTQQEFQYTLISAPLGDLAPFMTTEQQTKRETTKLEGRVEPDHQDRVEKILWLT